MTKIRPVLKGVRIHQHSKCEANPMLRSKKTRQNGPASLSQNGAKMRKINRIWPKCNQFQRWSGYITMLNFRPFLPCVLKKIPKNPNLTCFTKSKWRQNEAYQQTMIKILSVQEVIKIHQHVKFETIPPLLFQGNARKYQIWPVSQNQIVAKMRKINKPWPKYDQFSGGQDTSACRISCHSKWLQ